jgi:hypothetical protein
MSKYICEKAYSCKTNNCSHRKAHEETDDCILTLCSRRNELLKCEQAGRSPKHKKPRNEPTGPAEDIAGMQPAAFAPDCLPSNRPPSRTVSQQSQPEILTRSSDIKDLLVNRSKHSGKTVIEFIPR